MREKKKRERLPYPSYVSKDMRERAAKYADSVASKGTVGHESAFYDFLNGAIWGRNSIKP